MQKQKEGGKSIQTSAKDAMHAMHKLVRIRYEYVNDIVEDMIMIVLKKQIY